jgi:transcriptional regulator with XRE-family HTH domain
VGRLTTGLRPVDDLIGGARVGDNIVWQAGPGADLRPFVTAFVRAARTSPRVVYVSLHLPPGAVLGALGDLWDGERMHLVDLYTHGIGGGGSAPDRPAGVLRVVEAGDPAALYRAIDGIDGGWARGTRYVFDSLTGMQQLWGRDGALGFFLRACPRLYELRTVAYWLLERPAHEAAFLRRLARVTQVIVNVDGATDGVSLQVVKAAGRSVDVAGRRAAVRFDGHRATLTRADTGVWERMGRGLRRQRGAQGVSLSQLARAIGISPSALSQAERGVAGLSAETLVRALEVLGGGRLEAEPAAPFRISRRGTREVRTPARGMSAEFVCGGTETQAEPGVALVSLAPRAHGTGSPFETKQREVIVLLSGAIEVRVGGSWEVLQAGDALDLVGRPLSAWRNASPEEATALWAILPPAAGPAATA